MYSKVKAEVMKAYADCNMGWDKGSQLRDLDYFCEIAVTPTEAIEILTLALAPEDNDYDPNYNDFVPAILENLPEDAKVHIARDGSVCIYLEDNLKVNLDSDEFHMNESKGSFTNLTRYWWD